MVPRYIEVSLKTEGTVRRGRFLIGLLRFYLQYKISLYFFPLFVYNIFVFLYSDMEGKCASTEKTHARGRDFNLHFARLCRFISGVAVFPR